MSSHNYVSKDMPYSVCADLCHLVEGFPYSFGDL